MPARNDDGTVEYFLCTRTVSIMSFHAEVVLFNLFLLLSIIALLSKLTSAVSNVSRRFIHDEKCCRVRGVVNQNESRGQLESWYFTWTGDDA
jgi:hypothetical protein